MDNRSRTQRVDDQRRSRRVTLEQLGVLREFLTSHRDVGVGYNKSQQARAYSRDMWQKVATSLNSLDGAHKDWKEWAAYWSDYKGKLKTSVQKIRSSQNETGDPPNEPCDMLLDDIEPISIVEKQSEGIPEIQRDSLQNITHESEDSSAEDYDNAGEIPETDSRRRVTLEQLECLHEILSSHTKICMGHNKTTQARANSHELWQKVASSLNAMKGVHKDWKRWAKYWTDYKSKLKKKVKKIRSQNETGEDPADEPWNMPLEDIKQRFLLIIENHVTGTPGAQTDPVQNMSTQESEGSSADDYDNAGEIQKQKADNRRRVTLRQLEVLYEFISSHREMSMGCRIPQVVEYSRTMWEKAASSLNSQKGANKDWKQWAKYWSDYKSKLKIKVQKIRSSQINETGIDPVDEPWNMPLEDIEQRFLLMLENHKTGTPGAQTDPSVQNRSPQESEGSLADNDDNAGEIQEADKRRHVTHRVTLRQLKALCEFLSTHRRHVSMGYNKNLKERAYSRTMWEKAASSLNALDGPNKDWRMWAKYWTDYKSKLRKKVQKMKSSQSETGIDPADESCDMPLEDIEKRFLLVLENHNKGTPGARDPNMSTQESEDSSADDYDNAVEIREVDNRRRVTLRQLKVLYEILSSHRKVSIGRNRTSEARFNHRTMWEKAAGSLNSLEGANKDWRDWAKYWTDYKTKLKNRLKRIRASQNGSDDVSACELLDSLEQKFALLIEKGTQEDTGRTPGTQEDPFENTATQDSEDSLAEDHDNAEEPTLDEEDDAKTSEQNGINIQSRVSPDPSRNCHQSINGVSNDGLDIPSLPMLTLTPLNTRHNQQSSTIEYIDVSQRQPNLTHEVPNTVADEHTYFGMSIASLMRSLPPGVASGLRIRVYQMIHDATESIKLENENPLAM